MKTEIFVLLKQGTFLGAEIDVLGNEKSYKTKLVTEEETSEFDNVHKDKDSRFLKSQIFTFKIPHVCCYYPLCLTFFF